MFNFKHVYVSVCVRVCMRDFKKIITCVFKHWCQTDVKKLPMSTENNTQKQMLEKVKMMARTIFHCNSPILSRDSDELISFYHCLRQPENPNHKHDQVTNTNLPIIDLKGMGKILTIQKKLVITYY